MPACSLVPDLGSPSSVLCQQAAAAGVTQEALVRHLVSAAAVRSGGQPLPPLPEAALIVEQRAAAAEAAAAQGEVEEGSSEARGGAYGLLGGWSPLANMQPLDEDVVSAYVDEAFEFSTWCPPTAAEAAAAAADEEGGDEDWAESAAAASGFEFVDATQDPSLDPVAQMQQRAAEAAPAAELPIGYDDIRNGDPYSQASAAVGYGGEPGWEGLEQQQAEGGSVQHLDHMHPTKQRVWVLLGGDGPQRTQSLQAGLHAYLRWGGQACWAGRTGGA